MILYSSSRRRQFLTAPRPERRALAATAARSQTLSFSITAPCRRSSIRNEPLTADSRCSGRCSIWHCAETGRCFDSAGGLSRSRRCRWNFWSIARGQTCTSRSPGWRLRRGDLRGPGALARRCSRTGTDLPACGSPRAAGGDGSCRSIFPGATASVSEWNFTPRARRSSSMVIRSRKPRPSRSRFHTISVSSGAK